MKNALQKMLFALAALAASSAQADTLAETVNLFPTTFYYADGVRMEQATASSPVVSPSDAAMLPFTNDVEYTFTALAPAGHAIDEWVVASRERIINAVELSRLADIEDRYAGETVTVQLPRYPDSTGYYLCPCFSWFGWTLVYDSNFSWPGDFGKTDLVYTNAVTLAQPEEFWPYKRTGYDIVGWSLSKDGASPFAIGQTVENAGAAFGASAGGTVRLYAAWQKRAMTIALDAQGGTVEPDSITVYIDDTYHLPTPVRNGFIFLDWTTSPDGVNRIYDGEVVTHDDITALYAQWSLIKYRISYDWNCTGVGVAPSTQDCAYTGTVSLASAPDAARPGYAFKGWAKSADATSALYAPGQTFENSGDALGVTEQGQLVRLYGVWAKRPLRIALDAQGGEASVAAVTAVAEGTYSLPGAARPGFVFDGWWTKPDGEGGTKISDGDAVEDCTIETLYAHWAPLSFTLECAENTAPFRTKEMTLNWTDSVAISSLAADWVHVGWRFEGFAFAPVATGAAFAAGQTVEDIGGAVGAVQGGKITLYAVWRQKDIALALVDGSDTVADMTVHVQDEYVLPELERVGERFDGWWTEAVGGVQVTSGMVVENEDVTTLYARWTPKAAYTVTFNYLDENGDPASLERSPVYEGDDAPPPEDAVPGVGHTLTWTPDWHNITGDATITASYAPNKYKIAFHANGGQGTMPSLDMTYGELPKMLLPNKFSRGKSGAYTFGGWALAPDSTEVAFADSAYVTTNLATDDGATVTLYAIWVDNLATSECSSWAGANIALSCEDNYWTEATGVDTDSGSAAKAYSESEITELTGVVYGNGTLTFKWKVTKFYDSNPKFYLLAHTSTKMDDDEIDMHETAVVNGEWETATYVISGLAGDAPTELTWKAKFVSAMIADVKWTPDGQIVLDFNGGDGEGAMASVGCYKDEYVTLPLNEFALEGHTFAGWMIDDGIVLNDGACVDVFTSNTTLTAKWKANAYAVRYLAGGGEGTMPDQPMVWGVESALDANAFTRSGYAFAGWVCGAKEYTDGQVVSNLTATADETLEFTAKWQPLVYAVKFEPNGGAGEMTQQNMTYGVPASLTPNAYTLAGYSFAGWVCGNAVYADGETVAIEDMAVDPSGVATLVAAWEPVAYTVAFDPNGGEGEMAPFAVAYGRTFSLPPSKFTREGWTFAGWTLAGAPVADLAELANLASDAGATVTFSAVWKPNAYIVVFDANGGDGVMDDALMEYDSASPLIANSFTRKGFKFVGWAASADADAPEYADAAAAKNIGAEDGSVNTLYAVWAPVEYTVRFAANGGTGTMPDLAMKHGTAAKLPECAFVREGHEFASWSYGGKEYAPGDEIIDLTEVDGTVLVFAATWRYVEIEIEPVDPDVSEFDNTEIFPDGTNVIGEFTAEASYSYSGWLRDPATGAAYALILVKTTQVKKAGAPSKVTITVTPLAGKKTTYKTEIEPGENPVDEFGIVYGNLGLSGTFNGYVVEAARDFAKAKANTPERALAAHMPQGTWTMAFADGDGYSSFSVIVGKNGKAKVAGTLADGSRVSISAQGILGENYIFAVPALNAKKGVAFVLWVTEAGESGVSDVAANLGWTRSGCAQKQNLADGAHSLEFEMPTWREYLTQTEREGENVTPIGAQSLSVSGTKWKGVRQVGKVALEKNSTVTYVKIAAGRTPANLAALKMNLTAKTLAVRGSFKLWYLDGTRLRSDTATIVGSVVGGEFFGTAKVKKLGTFKVRITQ